MDLLRLQRTTRMEITPLRSLLPLLDAAIPAPAALATLIPDHSADGTAEEALRLLRRATWPPVAIVLTHGNDLQRAAMLGRQGAFAVLSARSAVNRIAQVVLEASGRAAQEASVRARFQQLTPRERDVLYALADGHPTPSIAERLSIAPATVKVHRKSILRKLGARSLVDLIRVADRAWPVRVGSR